MDPQEQIWLICEVFLARFDIDRFHVAVQSAKGRTGCLGGIRVPVGGGQGVFGGEATAKLWIPFKG